MRTVADERCIACSTRDASETPWAEPAAGTLPEAPAGVSHNLVLGRSKPLPFAPVFLRSGPARTAAVGPLPSD